MRISIELSLYPLHEEYGTPILKFIERLRSYPELEVRSNTMSTQVFGAYNAVMNALTGEMESAFATGQSVVLVAKITNLDLRS